MLKVAEHRPAMKLAHCSAMLDKSKFVYCRLALPFIALDKIDIFKLAGRRPVMKLAHCSAMLDKSKFVYCHLALPFIALDMLKLISSS